MDNKEKTNKEKRFQDGNFIFPFEKFEKMAEMMRSCCKSEGGMVDCCSVMRKMMQCVEGREMTEKKKKTEETV